MKSIMTYYDNRIREQILMNSLRFVRSFEGYTNHNHKRHMILWYIILNLWSLRWWFLRLVWWVYYWSQVCNSFRMRINVTSLCCLFHPAMIIYGIFLHLHFQPSFYYTLHYLSPVCNLYGMCINVTSITIEYKITLSSKSCIVTRTDT